MSSPSTKMAPYGSWKSPITSDLIVAQSTTLSELCLDDGQVYWLEGRPQEQGRYVVVRADPDSQTTDITSPPYNARTRVHEYGGGSWTVRNGTVYFSNFADGRLYRQVLDGSEPRGAAVIEKVREQQPVAYMKICALLVPREIKLEPSGGVKAMSDEQLDRAIEFIEEAIAKRDAGANAKVIEGEAEVAPSSKQINARLRLISSQERNLLMLAERIIAAQGMPSCTKSKGVAYERQFSGPMKIYLVRSFSECDPAVFGDRSNIFEKNERLGPQVAHLNIKSFVHSD